MNAAGKLHDMLTWWTELVWTGGSKADERRARGFPHLQGGPDGFPR